MPIEVKAKVTSRTTNGRRIRLEAVKVNVTNEVASVKLISMNIHHAT
jgi:hypothetical protein